jgi:hypothetical protein
MAVHQSPGCLGCIALTKSIGNLTPGVLCLPPSIDPGFQLGRVARIGAGGAGEPRKRSERILVPCIEQLAPRYPSVAIPFRVERG